MSITAENFVATFPEFTSVNTSYAAAVQAQITNADSYLSESFGDRREYAVYLYTAHRLRLRFPTDELLPQDSPAPITSQSIDTGGMNEQMTPLASMTSISAFEADLARTNYGVELLSLIKTSIAPAVLVTSPESDQTGARIGSLLP